MPDRSVLDDGTVFKDVDRHDMIGMVAAMPDDMSAALGAEVPEVPSISELDNIIFSGMGGSAIGGDILRVWLGERLEVPFLVNRGYDLPVIAGEDTLFVAVSFSGNTEEALGAFDDAIERGCHVVAFTSGGRLEERALAEGVSLYKIRVRDGTVPRAALGSMLVPMARLLEATGGAEVGSELESTITLMEDLREGMAAEVGCDDNEAKMIAARLHGTIPVVQGHGLQEVSALRWKTQLNENSKVLAWADAVPEMDHNSIVGWTGDPMAGNYSSVVLRDPVAESENPRIEARMEAKKTSAWTNAKETVEVVARGKMALERIMSTSYMGDFVSTYLAVLRKVDPTPVEAIDSLKYQLGKGRSE